ncbi:MAG: copper resistance protein CopB [Alphaproteobacteria bacterium RIFCSPHIGHO2_12_FULL_63_12]|nr:MAG: copper resistance protein CopB [Alphaproteobacteria bacterium RIFCSPHIGHO2_12_FULL_63_12]
MRFPAKSESWAALAAALLVATPAFSQEIVDPAATAAVRSHMQRHHGAGAISYVEGERLEYQTNDGDPVFLWDAQGYYGGYLNKLWIKTEGEYDFSADEFSDAEVQALYSRAIGSFWDVQMGVRHDFLPDEDRTYGVLGVQGLSPYLFEIDAAAFISGHGDVTARLEAEYEILLTQRLILQPRAELNLALQDVPALEIGSGLSAAEAGLRLRYEFRREFAPYVGVSWERRLGDTADFARAAGEDPQAVSFVAGVRLWF